MTTELNSQQSLVIAILKREKEVLRAALCKMGVQRDELLAAMRNITAGNGGECGCAETARATIAKAEDTR